MPPSAPSWHTWLRWNLAGSFNPLALRERLLWIALLAASGCLGWSAAWLSLPQQVILGGLLILAWAVLLRRGGLKLFGPVLFYELVCISRRNRYLWLRFLYVVALLLLLSTAYERAAETWTSQKLVLGFARPSPVYTGSATNAGTNQVRMSAFAESFFQTFMIVQFLVVAALTPAYTAGAIAEEKDRKTLEFLLATDLHNREIVLGKLVARLANLALLVLAGLPVLSLTQLWGGVDPNLVVSGFAATGLTLVSLASLSILISVYAQKSRDAIVFTYLAVLAYLGFSALSRVLLLYPSVASQAVSLGANPVTVGDLVELLNAGNLPVMIHKLRAALAGKVPLTVIVPGLLVNYAVFHVLVAGACSAWAVAWLRAEGLKQAPVRLRRAPRPARSGNWPRLGRHPMVWKEVVVESGFSFNRFGRLLAALIVLGSFVPALWIAGKFVFELLEPNRFGTARVWARLAASVNEWVRLAGTLVACLMLLSVALRAASSVSGERDRQTWDSLLTTPLESNTILYSKWLGSLLSVRWAGLWLGLIWGLGVFTGGLSVFIVPWLVLSWLVYGAFLALLGLWFSMTRRTTLQASLWTLAATALIFGGHMLVWLFCLEPPGLGPLGFATRTNEDWKEWVVRFQLYGLTPPAALGWLCFHGENLHAGYLGAAWEDHWKVFISILQGLAFWVLAAGVLAVIVRERFRAVTGRLPRRPRKR